MELDSALEKLGHWGKFQIINYSLLSIPIIFYAIFEFTYVFTAKQVRHRCFIPECESNPISTDFEPPWLKSAVPYKDGKPTKCQRYLPVPVGDIKYQNGTCSTLTFTENVTSCTSWVYEEYGVSIQSQWDITCDNNNWKLALVGTVNSIGRFFGNPISGVVSDRYGRRSIILGGLFFAGIAGLLQSFAFNYAMFIAFVFIDPLFNIGLSSAAFILGVELLGPNKRVLWCAFSHGIYVIGEALLGLVAWEVQHWRWTLRAFYAPAIFSILVLWNLPESFKWLVSKGRTKDARDILTRAARINGIPLEQLGLEEKSPTYVANGKHAVTEEITENVPSRNALRETLKSKVLLWRLLNCSFCWITTTFVYYGMSLHSVAVGGNEYMNFIMVSLIEAPASVMTYFLMEKAGRRTSMCASLILSGVSCIAFIEVPEKMQWLSLSIYLVGKFGITISYCIIYVLTAELFPTSARHTLFAFCSMIGRLGSIVAPQAPLLASYMKSLPMILFGTMSFACGITSLLFPETHGTKLPDTVQEAEDIGKNSTKFKNKSNHDDPKSKKSTSSISSVPATIPVQTLLSVPISEGNTNGNV